MLELRYADATLSLRCTDRGKSCSGAEAVTGLLRSTLMVVANKLNVGLDEINDWAKLLFPTSISRNMVYQRRRPGLFFMSIATRRMDADLHEALGL